MAKFIDAYKKVLNNEGIYSNDPDDAGGETYKGISRKANPNWDGWISIDAIKKAHPTTFKGILKKTPELEKKVQDLYKDKYWDCFELDDVPNQLVAEQMFDTAVNQGQTAAIRFAQRVLDLRETGKWLLDLLNKLVAIK
jgi:lysozyme family protein